MTPLRQPVRLTLEQRQPAAQLLAKAFQDDPLMKYVEPDEEKRASLVPWLMGTVVAYCVLYGEVYTTPDLEGVSCWLPPENNKLTLQGIIRSGMIALRLKLSTTEMRRFLVNMQYTERLHKQAIREKHWYLWAIGVEPECQGQGIGGHLLTPVLERASKDGVCCYLETHNCKNPPFYEKYGFEVVSDAEIPNHGLRVWGMIRKP